MAEQQPQNLVQASGAVATEVVAGLKTQPMLLAIVVLNLIAIGAAAWFMSRIIELHGANMQTLMKECFDDNGNARTDRMQFKKDAKGQERLVQ